MERSKTKQTVKCIYCKRNIVMNEAGYGYLTDIDKEWAVRQYYHNECLQLFEEVVIA